MSPNDRKTFMDWWYSSSQQAASPEQRTIAEAAWNAALTSRNDSNPRFKVAAHQGFDGQLYDLSGPIYPIEVRVSGPSDNSTLWVNAGPVCVLRIGHILSPVRINPTLE